MEGSTIDNRAVSHPTGWARVEYPARPPQGESPAARRAAPWGRGRHRRWGGVLLTLALAATPAVARVSGSPQWTLNGTQTFGQLGWSVGTAGDVDGDGYSDVIVGEPRFDNVFLFTTDGGRVRVYPGGPGGVGSDALWTEYGANLSQFGARVSTAGDVNGDGYDDIVVGAPYYTNGNTNEGAVWVYYGSATGPSGTISWSREGGQDGARMGHAVSTAGDVNGDGYDDLVIGIPFYSGSLSQQGRVQIFLGGPAGLASSPHRTLDGSGTNDSFGYVVGTAGDVNGDGYDDVLASAVYFEALFNPTDQGGVFCYYGSASGVDGTADWSDFGTQEDEYFGSSATLAGDVNGDGYGDVLVGAGAYDNGQAEEGHVQLYFGSAFGLSLSPDWSYESNQADAYLGDCVAPAGDVNADGYADLVIAATSYDQGEVNEGIVYVFYGSPDGPGTIGVWSSDGDEAAGNKGWSAATAGDVDGDGRSDIIVGMPGANGATSDYGRAEVFLATADDWIDIAAFSAQTSQAGSWLGSSLGYADVNADGYSDLLGGAERYDAGQIDEGRAYCWLGGGNGITNPASWYEDGEQAGARFGHVVTSAGDVDGDGYEDVVVTAPEYDDVLVAEGKAFLYRGSASGLESTPAWSGRGQQIGAEYGIAAAAGDFNADGYGDLVIGARSTSNPQAAEGSALLYLGSASGLGSAPAGGWEGNQASAYAGHAVAMADVNGDGFDDVVSAAPYLDDDQANEGAVFVCFGRAGTPSVSYDQRLDGNVAAAYFGYGLAAIGDVDGDGYADIAVGAPAYTNGHSSEGRVSVYLGSPTGLGSTPVFVYEPNAEGARFGEWIAPCGDVNADGFADFAVGAPFYGTGDEGRVYVFAGNATGVASVPIAFFTGDSGEHLGAASAGFGDVDGDGWPDLAVGAPFASSPEVEEGLVYLHYGNRDTTVPFAAGLERRLHMRTAVDDAPLALRGRSDVEDGFRLRVLGRTAFGRARVRAEWEVAPLGTTWTGDVGSTAWLDTGEPLPGQGSRVAVNQVVSGLDADRPHHFRVRFWGESPYFPRTPWFTLAGNSPMETDFRTGGGTSGIGEFATGVEVLRIERLAPNPAIDGSVLRFALARDANVRVSVHDVSGRRVRGVHAGRVTAGNHAIEWDGRGDGGQPLAPGVYFVRVQAEGQVARAKLIVAAER